MVSAGAAMSKDGWAAIGVGVAVLTVLVTVAGLVLEGHGALRAGIAELRAENVAFRQELRTDNAAFRKQLRAENAAFRQELRTDNAAFRKQLRTGNTELRADIREVAEQTAQLRDRVTRLEVLVGVVVERLLPSDALAELTEKKISGHP